MAATPTTTSLMSDQRVIRWMRMVQIGAAIQFLDLRLHEFNTTKLVDSDKHITRVVDLFNKIFMFQKEFYHDDHVEGEDEDFLPLTVRRFMHEMPSLDDLAYVDITRSPIEPEDEQFPEGRPYGGSCHVDKAIHESRYKLLKALKSSIYQDQDHGRTVQETITNLWQLFMHQIRTNLFLRKYFEADEICLFVDQLDAPGQAEVLAFVGFDTTSLSNWLAQVELAPLPKFDGDLEAEEVVYREVMHFTTVFDYCQDLVTDYVETMGFAESSGLTTWYDHVQSWDQIGDEETCFVSLNAYEIPFEATMVAVKGELPSTEDCVPIQLRKCKHIVCLGCLGRWSESLMENKHKCPLCRVDLFPPNEQITISQTLREDYHYKFVHDDLQSAGTMLAGLRNSYFLELPAQLRQTSFPDYTTNQRLTDWHQDIFGSSDAAVAACIDTGCQHGDQCTCKADDERVLIMYGRSALELFRFTHQRFKAYIQGDSVRYKAACRNELSSLAAHLQDRNVVQMSVFENWTFDSLEPAASPYQLFYG